MPGRRNVGTEKVVYRTARIGLHTTAAQRQRCFSLLRAAGDVWACVLEINSWRRRHGDTVITGYQELCRLLAESGPGTFGDLDSVGARSVLRRYSDAWFAAAARRKAGHRQARFPRRRRSVFPVRWYHGTFRIEANRLRLPTAAGCPPLWLRLNRAVPYPPSTIRAVSLLFDAGRLWIDVTAELPIATYPPAHKPDPALVAGVDLGIIHPYAVTTLDGQALLISGRAVRAEHRMHLADTKSRGKATATHAPKAGQRWSRRWRKTRRRVRKVEGVHRRRVRQVQHEAAKSVIDWAVEHRIGTLTVGDPRGVLDRPAGRRHNLRLRQWQIGRCLATLVDKAVLAGIRVHLVDERGTSSTCPSCHTRIPKPAGRSMRCRHCQFAGHRDLVAAFNIATRTPGSGITTPPPASPVMGVVTHRRAGRHLPGAGPSRRDPRRRSPAVVGSLGPRRPAPPDSVESRSITPERVTRIQNVARPGERSWTPHYAGSSSGIRGKESRDLEPA